MGGRGTAGREGTAKRGAVPLRLHCIPEGNIGAGGDSEQGGGSKRRKAEVAPQQESAKPAATEEDADPFAEMGASGKDDGFSAADDSDVLYRNDFYPSEDGLMPVGGAGAEQWLDAPMPDADMGCGAADEVTMFAVQDELMGAADIGELTFD